jgi:hypothetical protein
VSTAPTAKSVLNLPDRISILLLGSEPGSAELVWPESYDAVGVVSRKARVISDLVT